MRTKGFILTIAIALVLICIFYLSFSFVANHYDNIAVKTAMKANKGSKDEASDTYKNAYKDYINGIENVKVWPWKNAKYGYTYKEVREKQLGLGLDLKGGMTVTLEIPVKNVITSLAGITGEKQDITFDKAIKDTKDESSNYIAEFCENYKKNGGNLRNLFNRRIQKIKDNPQAKDEEIQKYIEEEVDNIIGNSINVLRTRIDRFGVIAPNIQNLSSKKGRVLLELPGIKDPDRVLELLKRAANLEFYETYKIDEIKGQLKELSDKYATSAATSQKRPVLMNLLEGGRSCVVGNVTAANMAEVDSIIHSDLAKEILPNDLKLCWTVKAEKEDKGPEKFALIALRLKKTDDSYGPVLTGDVVTNAEVTYDRGGLRGNDPSVSMAMNNDGSKKWARITFENKGKPVAIVLDDQVYTYPNVNDQITGGRSEITGNFTPEEATDLANVLQSGKMDAKPEVVSQHIIGPSLGQESINKGLTSFVVALILLMIFMVCVYGIKAGSIANLGLIFNLFFTAGILASFQTVLTLPGIAGIVLALGMAVDANVLIFERIKEELRAGKGLKAAVNDGYGNAFSAIFDSNLTTIITMIILAWKGSGAIQGFAITTIVGVCCSFFTAVYLTRIILEGLINIGWFANISFSTPWTRHLMENVNFNFMGKAKTIGIIAAILILAIIAMFFIPGRGLSPGIEFSGGRNFIIQFDQPVNAQNIGNDVKTIFPKGTSTSVITIDNDSKIRVSTNYKNNAGNDDSEIKENLYNCLKKYYKKKDITFDQFNLATDKQQDNANKDNINSEKIGIQDIEHVDASIANEMRRDAYWLVGFALLAMFIYILLRFRNVAFSTGALAAVAFTAFVVIGFYTLHGIFPFAMEINQTFIAAILTVIGYQVNDTVVVFDRVREYRKLYPKQDLKLTFNKALSSTLARTTMTSVTTLLVLFVIFFLGGVSIRSFIFAMILGVIIGTCSSLFIASPVAYAITNALAKKKENRKKDLISK